MKSVGFLQRLPIVPQRSDLGPVYVERTEDMG